MSACTVRPHTEEELTALIRWAEMARMDNMLVDMVLEGKMRVEWTPENEPQFNSVNTKDREPHRFPGSGYALADAMLKIGKEGQE